MVMSGLTSFTVNMPARKRQMATCQHFQVKVFYAALQQDSFALDIYPVRRQNIDTL
jgi:hypothetical protein